MNFLLRLISTRIRELEAENKAQRDRHREDLWRLHRHHRDRYAKKQQELGEVLALWKGTKGDVREDYETLRSKS